jgi:hypothetical protein
MEGVGDVFQLDGVSRPIPMGLVAAAGKPNAMLVAPAVPAEPPSRASTFRRLRMSAGASFPIASREREP